MPEIVQALATALMQNQRKPDMAGRQAQAPPPRKRLVRFWAQDKRGRHGRQAVRSVPLEGEVRYAPR